MRRLAIFTIIGILALAGCGDSAGSSPPIDPTTESGDGESAIDKNQKLLKPWDFPKDSDERSPLAEISKTKDGTKTRESRTPKADTGPTPVTLAGPGICGRTPEIQEKLIEMLQIRSCQVINAAELYRVRKFSASAQSFKVGDFDNLPNLQVLELRLNKNDKARPVELGPNIFKDLQNLTRMEINNDTNKPTIRLNKDTFMGLNNLIVLDMEYIGHLPEGTLDHLQQLNKLSISDLKGDIPSKALEQLHNVQSISISISPYTEENSNPRTLPTDFLKNLPKLESVSISKEYLPDSMEINSYKTACHIGEWGLRDKEGNRMLMTIDGKTAELTDRTTDHDPINERDVRICRFNVGDTETKKIIIPLK